MSGRVDFSLVREASRTKLSHMLDNVPGNKAIVWEKELAGTFSLVGDFSYLRGHNVTQMFYLSAEQPCAPASANTHVIFITKPRTASMDLVNLYLRGLLRDSGGVSNLSQHDGNLSSQQSAAGGRQLHLWLVPRTSLLCERRLQEHGVLDVLTSVTDLPLLLFKMESDLVSMEMPQCFMESCVLGDPGCIHLAARALMLLQAVYGVIPNIRGKGPHVTALYNMLVDMRRELAPHEPQVPSQIEQVVVVERSVDLITPLTTQLTYEGLIHHFFGIHNCVVKLPAEKFKTTGGGGGSGGGEGEADAALLDHQVATPVKSVLLTSADALYAELRDANFSAVGPKLVAQAKQITREFDERHQAKTVVEMKHFVQKLPRIQAAKQSLALHTSLAEVVQEEVTGGLFPPALQFEQELLRGAGDSGGDKPAPFLESAIAGKAPLIMVLRLLCLQSVINNGLKPRLLEYYKRDIIQTYGYHHILTLDNLARAGLLLPQTSKSNYATIRKTLRLTVDDVNELYPTDIAYVHSGYAPLSVRLVVFAHSPGWRAITELLRLLPGPTLTETQHLASTVHHPHHHRRGDSEGGGGGDGAAPVVLVFFLGGCTYTEVAALRFLSARQHEQGGPEYVIATTSLLHSSGFLGSLAAPLLPDTEAA